MLTDTQKLVPYFLSGGGEMSRIAREFDWTTTPLGDPETWPYSLRNNVSTVLNSRFPMILWWGPELIQIYNDAFRPSFGTGKHPAAFGQKARDCWQESWDYAGPLVEKVLETGEAVWAEDQLIPNYRNGKLEDVWWTFCYSPAYDDTGKIAGVLVICNETTDKVLSIKKLEESNLRFKSLVMQAPVAIAVFRGPQLIAEIANDAYLPLVDRKREDFVGMPLLEALPEGREVLEPLTKNILETGEPFIAKEYELTLNRNDRLETCYFNANWEPLREPDGTVNGFMAVVHEVTEQVVAHKILKQKEQQIRSIVESAPFPIGVYTGKEMRIELANQTMLDTWGKGNDVIGRLYSEILPELQHQQIFEQLAGVYDTGQPFHARNQRVDLVVDGVLQTFYFNYSFTPLFDEQGAVYGVMNTAANVTDLVIAKQKVEQSERNFRSMVLQAPVAMCIMLGPTHIIEVANKMMIELWGKPVDAVMKKPVFEALPDARNQGLEDLLDRVYTTGQAVNASEMPVKLLRNGRQETVYQNFVYEPYRNADGEILGVLAISVDVTEQVLARQKIEDVVEERTRELASANERLEKSNAELAQFAYIASHDLQEPLRKIRVFTQLLKGCLGAVDEKSQGYISKIETASSRMTTLIKDVLAYSELTKDAEIRQPVDLQKIIDEVAADFELLIEEKKASIIVSGGLPVVQGIPLQMSQLFSNLVSNALKFSRDDVKPEIRISAKLMEGAAVTANPALDKAKDYHVIELKDNGIGFDPDQSMRIFNIFQRLHSKNDYSGTGIGLAMCKKIAQNHSGDIWATSQPGGGASFYIALPA